MTQEESPDPTGISGETHAPENVTSPPPAPAQSSLNRRLDAADPFAVGVRVLRMAPVWLLSVTAGCSLLILMLGWMNPGGMSNAVAYAPALNDARPSRTSPPPSDSRPAAPAQTPEAAQPASVPGNAAPAPETVPAPAAEQAAAETRAVEQSAQPAPAAPPQAVEQAQAEAPAMSNAAAGTFTVQVGSFNNQSEANERVSKLRAAGFESRAVAVEIHGRTWYRVQVGRFADRAEASKAVASLRAKGAAGSIVVPLQN